MSEPVPLNPKLTHRLRRALLITLIAVLVLATIAAAVTAYYEASDIQDETLLSVAQLAISNQISTVTDDDVFDDDDFEDSAVRVWEYGRDSRRGIKVDKSLKSGFHTLHEGDSFWRVYITNGNRRGQRFIVAQKLSVSAELALNSAKNTAIPLLLLFLVVPLLVTWIVRHSFKPLNSLASKVGNSDSLQLNFTDKQNIPVELMPFITAIDALLEKNEAYNQRQQRFIADAAHELRTPITALSLQIDNLQSASNETLKVERQAVLSKSISRLQRLVSQLLDLARVQSGIKNSQSTVSLNDQVKNEISDLFPFVDKKHINLSVSRNEPVLVNDNNHQLQHLIRNALSNAIKYTHNYGAIDVEIYKDHDKAVFCVSDNGPGVPPEHLNKLHQPFFRPDDQASGDGAGLGLAICHETATQLHGQITLENLQAGGFRFSYRQPAMQ
jgi:signal transduction histidine kinase